jgi:hypothetical protein
VSPYSTSLLASAISSPQYDVPQFPKYLASSRNLASLAGFLSYTLMHPFMGELVSVFCYFSSFDGLSSLALSHLSSYLFLTDSIMQHIISLLSLSTVIRSLAMNPPSPTVFCPLQFCAVPFRSFILYLSAPLTCSRIIYTPPAPARIPRYTQQFTKVGCWALR